MRYRLSVLLVLLVLSVPFVNAATFTASHSGDWNTPSTWGLSGSATCGTNIPCMTSASLPGDTVTIPDNITVTCTLSGENCSAGASLAARGTAIALTHVAGDAGGIHIGGTATFVYAGDVDLTAGTFTVDAGGLIQHDSSWSSASTSINYHFATNSTNSGGVYGPAVFAINGTPGNHVTWQGDSYYSSLSKPSACAVNTCLAGAVGWNGTSYNDMGGGTISYLDVKNVAGTVRQGALTGWNLSVMNNSTTMTGVTFNKSGYVGVVIVAGATGSFTFDRGAFTNCAASGCLTVQGTTGSATGTYAITNTIADYTVYAGLVPTAHNFTYRNIFIWTNPTAGIPGQGPGFHQVDASTFDQLFIDNNSWNTGTSIVNGRSWMPSNTITNSVLWDERTIANSYHNQTFQGSYGNTSGTGPFLQMNNVFGSMGIVGPGSVAANTFGGIPPGGSSTATVKGNVNLCGYNGTSSASLNTVYISNGNTSNVAITEENNTSCSGVAVGLGSAQQPNGTAGAETITVASGTIALMDSNLFFRNDAGGPIAEVCDFVNTSYNATPWIALLENNAVVNTNTSAAAICTASAGWVVTGPVGDIIIQNRPPALVEPNRSVPLFDTEYLQPAGLLNVSSYGATPWASGTSYTVGQYVSDSQTGVFGGKTTYWRCTQAHTASSLNRPVTGIDAANPYRGHEAFWEEAYLPWFRAAVTAGTQYTDGAIGANNVYVVGLLNAWLRQGMTSMEPRLWNGCLNGKECGAIQLTVIQHIPPPAAVN